MASHKKEGSFVLLQKVFCLINFRRQVWASSSIRVVEQHELSVFFSNEFLGEASFSCLYLLAASLGSGKEGKSTGVPKSKTPLFCSSATRSHLCRTLSPVHLCRLCIFEARQALRDPVRNEVRFMMLKD